MCRLCPPVLLFKALDDLVCLEPSLVIRFVAIHFVVIRFEVVHFEATLNEVTRTAVIPNAEIRIAETQNVVILI